MACGWPGLLDLLLQWSAAGVPGPPAPTPRSRAPDRASSYLRPELATALSLLATTAPPDARHEQPDQEQAERTHSEGSDGERTQTERTHGEGSDGEGGEPSDHGPDLARALLRFAAAIWEH